MHQRLLPEAHLGLRGMHVDVHLRPWHLQKQQHHRIHRAGQNIAIGLGDGVLHQPVADEPLVHENKDRVAVQLLDLGLRHKSVQSQLARRRRLVIFTALPRRRLRQSSVLQLSVRRHRQQLVQRLLAKDLEDALGMRGHRRRHQHGVGGRVQLKMQLGMRQRVVRHQRGHVRQLGALCLEKFFPRWNVKE